MDGHTKEGSYKVTLELTGDMVSQLTRLIETAKLMNGRDFNTLLEAHQQPEPFDIIAHRAFLQEILQILYKGLEDKPV